MIQISMCQECGQEFVVDRNWRMHQARCPKCADERQAKYHKVDSVVLDRNRTFATTCKIHSLPGEWLWCEPIHARAHGYWKMEVRGSRWGEEWEGICTIFAQGFHGQEPPKQGDMVYFRAMEARKMKKAIHFSHPSHPLSDAPDYVQHTAVLPVWFEPEMISKWVEEGNLSPQAEGKVVVEYEHTHRYVVLSPTNRDHCGHTLVWAQATSKSTIKGLGAQYAAEIDLNATHWHQEIGGGLRNRRKWTRGILAIVPDRAQITITTSGHTGSGKGWSEVATVPEITDVPSDGDFAEYADFDIPDFIDADDEDLLGEETLRKLRL